MRRKRECHHEADHHSSISRGDRARHLPVRPFCDGEADRADRGRQAEWETIHGQLCLFLQHEHLDPLESVFAVLPYYIEQGEIALAQSECRLVRSVTEHILKTERVTLENIL